MQARSLSLEQAPPYRIPLRFFITAPVLGMLAALLIMLAGPQIWSSRWSSGLLAVTHLLTLGYMSMVMLGAMLQMLPVLAGAPVPKVVLTGGLVHFFTLTGSLLLAAGFVWAEQTLLLTAAAMLTLGYGLFVSMTMFALYRKGAGNPTIQGMRVALMGLLLVVGLGLLLTLGFTGRLVLPSIHLWTNVHLSWGIAGWFAVLLISVSYQVVPMFQVTPEYPKWMRRWLLPLLLITLAIWSLLSLKGASLVLETMMLGLLLLELTLFAATTLWLFSKRKRKVPDNTVLFWRIGISLFGLVMLLLILGKYLPAVQLELILGVLIVQGILLTMINGMLYRIVPFLSWFHLQHLQLSEGRFDMKLPHMKSFITDQAVRRQFYVHLASLFCMLGAVYYPQLMTYPAAILFFLSNLLLMWNLGMSWSRHNGIRKEILGEG